MDEKQKREVVVNLLENIRSNLEHIEAHLDGSRTDDELFDMINEFFPMPGDTWSIERHAIEMGIIDWDDEE